MVYIKCSLEKHWFIQKFVDNRLPGGHGGSSGGPMMAWTPSIGAIEPSDNESEQSGSASPSGGGGSHSPLIANPARSDSVPAVHQVIVFRILNIFFRVNSR